MSVNSGIVTDWNDKKGYGFIAPKEGGKNIFFHINHYSRRHKRPRSALKVQYSLSADKNGRPCAIDVAPVKGHRDNAHETRQKVFSLLLLGAFLCVLSFVYFKNLIPIQIVGLYGITSVIAFLLYAADKHAAKRGTWRTPENTLHILSVIGGWPGAKIAQSFLRHKSKKLSFRIVYWFTVVINCGVLYWFTMPQGAKWLHSILQSIKN